MSELARIKLVRNGVDEGTLAVAVTELPDGEWHVCISRENLTKGNKTLASGKVVLDGTFTGWSELKKYVPSNPGHPLERSVEQ